MKTPLVLLLVLSLAGNAVLAVMMSRRPAASPVSVPVAAAVSAPQTTAPTPATAAAAAPATPSANWQALQSGRNLTGLVANLRSAGFPPSVVRAMVRQLVTEQQDRSALDNMPFWKQNPGNPEYLAAIQAMNARTKEQMEALLGADAKPSAALDASTKARRYGNLTDDKIDRIEALNQEYGELRTQMYAQRRPGDMQGMMAAQNAVEEERRAEMAAFLTPAELEQYEMRASAASSRVANNLKGIEVNEQEFTELFRAQKAFEVADPARTGVMDPNAMAKRNQAQDALNEQSRAVLGDDRFYEYLKGADFNYARAAQAMANFPSVSPAQTYELVRLEREFQTATMTLARNNQGNLQAAGAAVSALRQEYQNNVNALVGEEAGKAFAQRNRAGATTTTTGTVVFTPRGP